MADQAQKVVSSQIAQAGARGESQSPSVEAIQSKTFNDFNQDEKNLGLNLQFNEDAIEAQRDAMRYKEYGDLIGDVAKLGAFAATLA